MTWLAVRFLGFPRIAWIAAVAVAAALTALALWLARAERADDQANQQLGASAQREADLRVTLDRTEEAHAARNAIRDPGDRARHDQCLRTARTPANCQRFLPRGAADQR